MQGELSIQALKSKQEALPKETAQCNDLVIRKQESEADVVPMPNYILNNHVSEASNELAELGEANSGSNFLRRFPSLL